MTLRILDRFFLNKAKRMDMISNMMTMIMTLHKLKLAEMAMAKTKL